MTIKTALRALFDWMPVIFGIWFVAPVIAAFIVLSGVDLPFDRAPIELGLALGLGWGIIAKVTGRWI